MKIPVLGGSDPAIIVGSDKRAADENAGEKKES